MKLSSSVAKLPFVGPAYIQRLKKLNIMTISDLLLHVPSRYRDLRNMTTINKIKPNEMVSVQGKISKISNIYTRSKKRMQTATISDSSGKISVIWFNQPYLAKALGKDTKVVLAGKVDYFGEKLCLISPDYEKIIPGKKLLHTQGLVPIYPVTNGISSKWLRNRITHAHSIVSSNIDEYLPKALLSRYKYISYRKAIEMIHQPKSVEQIKAARKRLAFDELLKLQLTIQKRKYKWRLRQSAYKIDANEDVIHEFIDHLPFKLTKDQQKASREILIDLAGEIPMNRLFEGDVGSGKTVVAAIAAFACFYQGHQVAFMAPTQLLAEQHFDSLKRLFDKYKIRTHLITSAKTIKDPGRLDIIIGTHSLIHRQIDFDNVALVVIDEQHRFGVKQRQKLIKLTSKNAVFPHVLTMTATPIPRTMSLTIHGDLDLSTLKELPKGRKPTTTWIVPPAKRKPAHDWIKKQLATNSAQVFVICPLIEESTKESMKQIKAATVEYEKLVNIFDQYKVGLLHGRQTNKVKNKILGDFRRKTLDILVTTPVVEVGIDIPSASIILIEAAERFGLAQLHQLRGRVGRDKQKSYCLLFSDQLSKGALARLNSLTKTTSGFELAEIDLKLRGPGESLGIKQHGFPELKIAAWTDVQLIKRAKNIAEDAINHPQKYTKLFAKYDLGGS